MRLLLPVVILAVLLAGLWFSQSPTPPADVSFNISTADTLDPQHMHWSQDIFLSYAIFEGLVSHDPKTLAPAPGVAESWQIGPKLQTFAFHLRHDARWSNGDPITAADFMYAWRVGLMPENAAIYTEFLMKLRGAEDFAKWARDRLSELQKQADTQGLDAAARIKLAKQRQAESVDKFKQLVDVQAPDPYTLIVHTQTPLPYFLDIAAFPMLFPLDPKVLDAATKIDPNTLMARRDPKWTMGGRLVGNGPFMLTQWRFKRDKYFEPNPYYWDRGQVKIKSMRAVTFDKVTAATYAAYETGELNWVRDAMTLPFAPELIALHREGKQPDAHMANRFGTYYYAFNCRDKLPDGSPNPFRDPRVRRAFAMAVDKQGLVDDVTRLHQQVANVFVPPNSIPGYPSPKGLHYDLDAARKLLAEAGYPDGKGMPTITVGYNEGGHELIAQALAHMWEAAFHVHMTLSSMETKVYGVKQKNGEFMISRLGWIGDYADPTTFLDLLRADSGNNPSGYDDPAFAKLLDRAAVEHDPHQRMLILSEAEKRVDEQTLPIVPLYYYQSMNLFDADHIHGISLNARELEMFQYLRVTH